MHASKYLTYKSPIKRLPLRRSSW